MTVNGEVAAAQLGKTLPHEHLLVDFVGADKVSPDRYDADEAFRIMLPYLQQARIAGCETIVECTPAFLGRDPKLLERLADASGVKLITNTGYYGARQGMFLPGHAHHESANELAQRWTAEWNDGIDATGIRPGFIKIGVDAGPLTEVNRKLVQAAARCHRNTGLTIAGHTGDGTAALEQVDVLRKEGVSPSAWIWVHAQNERNPDVHLQVARAGAWVEFDGVGPNSIDQHVELVRTMQRAGLLAHVLVSHDAGWYSVGEPRGGNVRGFDTLFAKFLPALLKAGLNEEELTMLTVTNPAKAFAIATRVEPNADSKRENHR
jgi:phosphotriesterase-related protein